MEQYLLYRYTAKGGGDMVAVTDSEEIAIWWKSHGTVDGIKHCYQATPEWPRRDDLPLVKSVCELSGEIVVKIEGDLSWLERFPNGRLLEQLRKVPEMEELWSKHCHFEGCHSRPNGSRKRSKPSPMCGSLIHLSDTSETVMVHQIEYGNGPLQIWVFRNRTVRGFDPSHLSTQVLEIIRKYRFPWAGFGGGQAGAFEF